MSAWFALAAPYIPEIIKIARPLFTRGNPKDESLELATQQIAELQTAAIQNAESIKLLATEMQHTLEALQKGASVLEVKLDHARTLLVISATVSVLAFCIAIYALVH